MLVSISCLCLTAMVEGRSAPADKKTYSTTDVIGVETIYRIDDGKIYDVVSQQPRVVERIEYTSNQYGEPATHYANVYLPYEYDKNGTERYHILYFFHGSNENPESFITDERAKNSLNNMIEAGIAQPFIAVFPTYYFDYANSRELSVEKFVKELREELMPAVESIYRTYALTADDAGFRELRMERAFAGYSRGGRMTWQMFAHMLDYSYWYLPMSGAFSNPENDAADVDFMAAIHDALEAQPEYQDNFFLYVSCGSRRDLAFDGCTKMVNEMIADDEHFSYGLNLERNNLYYPD